MTEKRPQTIQFFLPHGEPRGIRIAEITTRIVQAVFVPRSKLAEASQRPELQGVGVYFLFGHPEGAAKPIVYIGEAENCLTRLKQHNATKDFWQQAIAVVSRTGTFTKSHVRYLEWYCIRQAQKVGRYTLENGNNSGEPATTEPMRADLMDAYDTLSILISSLGFQVLEVRPEEKNEELFYITAKDADARGQMVEDGFTVLVGSKACKAASKSVSEGIINSRNELMKAGILKDDGERLVFAESYTFNTPSGAAAAVLGASSNGWTAWKGKSGQTLDELKRQSSDTIGEG